MELRMTEVNFPQKLEFNYEEIKQEVTEKVALYKNLVYTDDQIKEAKADRAKLNNFVKVLEDKRKEIKKQCLQPYEDFERQIKEIVSVVNEPIALIDKQIKEADTGHKRREGKTDVCMAESIKTGIYAGNADIGQRNIGDVIISQ